MDEDLLKMSATLLKAWFASATREEVSHACEELAKDPRKKAQVALSVLKEVRTREKAENKRLLAMFQYERELWDAGKVLIAGVDEVGRGPLAGPVLAAAVILKPGTMVPGLNDSKQVPAPMRERLHDVIMARAIAVGIGAKDVTYIDKYNIAQASFAAMRDALSQLPVEPEYILVDGFRIPKVTTPQRAIVKGDALSNSIAAASIVAKVTRDRLMDEIHEKYPQYGFSSNRGYSTRDHLQALTTHGPCPEHRRSFTSVMSTQLLLDDVSDPG